MHKKIIALFLICSVLGSSTTAFATTNTNSKLNNNTSIQVNTSNKVTDNQLEEKLLIQTLINKATPFIKTSKVDPVSRTF